MKKCIVFVLIIAALFACSKDELSNENLTENSNIKIYVENFSFDGKSEVISGDTIDGLRNIFTIMHAEENGNFINVFWKIVYQNPFFDELIEYNYYGDQISHKFDDLGYYNVKVGLEPGFELGLINEFTVFINGVPGKLGDCSLNNYIFRIERKITESNHYFLIFFKYLYQGYDKYVELKTFDKNSNILSHENIDLSTWYYDNYAYFTLFDLPSSAAKIQMIYKYGDDLIDPNLYYSSWFNGEGIEFSIFSDFEPPLFSCGDPITFSYNGSTVTYNTVLSNGRCWLDRNLGALRVPVSLTDELGFGDLFQWGRLDDGHQNKLSNTTLDLSSTDNPGHNNFIVNNTSPRDWRSPQNDNLWQGADGVNNPCPAGWRVPTINELQIELTSWSPKNGQGAYNSTLKWPKSGRRNVNGSVDYFYGFAWSSNPSADHNSHLSSVIRYDEDEAFMFHGVSRASGLPVRCIKDN